ncbi:hypothetical protein DFH29DRAFT_1010712 [Suillus ampliporus]|nr:hypothetical protein DFH29DRAFT_1010712 [Suillus ampliporus]
MSQKAKEKQKEAGSSKGDDNTLKIDRRPVQASGAKEQGAKVTRLNAALETAMLGIGKINILKIGNKLTFGAYNDRPQKAAEVNKMLASFEKYDIQAFVATNTLAIVIDPGRLEADQELKGDWNDPKTLTEVRFQDDDPLVLASGQHRYAALKKMEDLLLEDQIHLEKRLDRLEHKEKLSDEDVEEHGVLRTMLSEVKSDMSRIGYWGVTLYDKSIIDANKNELGNHLSRNQSLHVYAETHEEQLVMTLRNMYDAYEEGGDAAAMKVLDAEYSRPTQEKNSKLTKILKNNRLMFTLMRDLLPLGRHFRNRNELNVRWLYQAMDVVMGMHTIFMSRSVKLYRLLASKDDFPTYQTISALVDSSESDDEEGATATKTLEVLHKQILAGAPGNAKLFVSYMEEINEQAVKCFQAYEGVLGTVNADYNTALRRYRDDVVERVSADHGLLDADLTGARADAADDLDGAR